MSSREHIIELSRRLEKAINKCDVSKVFNILDALSQIDSISVALLKETNLGKAVNGIRKKESFKHAANIRDLSQSLVTKWKNQVHKERSLQPKLKKKSNKNGASSKRLKLKNNSHETSNHNNINHKKSPSPQQADSTTKHEAVKAENDDNHNAADPGYDRDPYDWETGDSGRDRMISKFISVLRPIPDKPEYIGYDQLAAEIEGALCTEYGSMSDSYRQKYRDLHFNLKKNVELRMEVLLGHIKPSKLVTMSSEEMAPKELKKRRDTERKWAMEEARNDHALNVSQAMTDEYKCGKCKKRKCKYSQAQTRSADEPMTTFVTCLTCGNRWKC